MDNKINFFLILMNCYSYKYSIYTDKTSPHVYYTLTYTNAHMCTFHTRARARTRTRAHKHIEICFCT